MRKKSREAIQWRPELDTFVGRVRLEDGSRTKWTRLGTNNRELAQAAYDHWFLTGILPMEARGRTTFEDAARAFVKAELASGDIVDRERGKDRLTRLEKYAFPIIGMLPVGAVESGHAASVLDAMAKAGRSARTALKMRSDISVVLGSLVRLSQLRQNVALGVALGAEATVDNRRRVSLSDGQVVRFHEVHGYRKPITMMALFCRQIAGHRTSDIHAAAYEHMDTVDYVWMHVRRPKTDGETGAAVKVGLAKKTKSYELVRHEIDEGLRPLVRAYHEAAGSPTTGPIFPLLRDGVGGTVELADGRSYTRRGSKAGERKRGTGNSYAKALRRMVWQAELYDPMPLGTLVGGVATTKAFDPERPDRSLCRFQTDTDETLRLDFQSLRRALVTAVADAEVPDATQLAITGHTQASTQRKHYMQQRTVRVPKKALPGAAVAAPLPPAPPPANAPLTPSATEHALLAALSVLTAKVDALSKSSPEDAPPAARPHSVGTKRPNSAFRVLAGGKKG